MAMDSLALALFLGLLGDLDSTMSTWEQQMFLDSVTITLTVEITESLFVDPGPIQPERNMAGILQTQAVTGRRIRIALFPSRAAALATAWGVGDLFGEEIGYLSVIETAISVSWGFRTLAVRSLATPREQELRWSLVHGVF